MKRVGIVASINVSSGGVPKLPLTRARITVDGVDGDRQRDLKHHGGVDRAVCLYALECIDALRAEGHAIGPGTLGENLTVAGLAWDLVVPDVRLAVGESVLEITSYTTPCRTIQRFFADQKFGRVSQKIHAGWSRLYARVLREGEVRAGDRIVWLDDPAGG